MLLKHEVYKERAFRGTPFFWSGMAVENVWPPEGKDLLVCHLHIHREKAHTTYIFSENSSITQHPHEKLSCPSDNQTTTFTSSDTHHCSGATITPCFHSREICVSLL